MRNFLYILIISFLFINNLPSCSVCKYDINYHIKNVERRIDYLSETKKKYKKSIEFYYFLGVHHGLYTAKVILKKHAHHKKIKKFNMYPRFLNSDGFHE